MAHSAVGVIFSNIHDENIPELSRHRTMASIPFGGRYRLIDFALSNMVNSGITTVGIVTKNNYQSLIDHLVEFWTNYFAFAGFCASGRRTR